ncbi:hypothetical protein [Methylobacterium terricola]|uniref:hypothetical protein n=1 Tax=Methylobacterium terricola TaxID=2583531 RepID=UPI001FE4F91D|nr:hypothetical protein [Methylobacterium terricola]
MPKDARPRPRREGVASAERVLTILTAYPSGTDALETFGLVERLDDGRYRLGVEAARIGSVCRPSFAPAERVVPALERLAAMFLAAMSMETATIGTVPDREV